MPTLFQNTTQTKKSKGAIGPLTAYALSPHGVRFETQEEEEEVILFLRQHPIVLLPQAVIGIFLIFAPSVLLPLLLRFNASLPVYIPPGYIAVGILFWYVATFGFLLATFLNWFFNIYIVTNKRIIDIDFIHLLYKRFSEANLVKIQDITYTSSGIVAAFFNYGDVFVQTAGELPNIEFMAVPHPEKVVKIISERISRVKGDSGI